MFSVGEEVICVDNRPGYFWPTPCPLKLGATYIVLEIRHIQGVDHVKTTGDRNIGWSVKRFRRPEIDTTWIKYESREKV